MTCSLSLLKLSLLQNIAFLLHRALLYPFVYYLGFSDANYKSIASLSPSPFRKLVLLQAVESSDYLTLRRIAGDTGFAVSKLEIGIHVQCLMKFLYLAEARQNEDYARALVDAVVLPLASRNDVRVI